MNHKYYSVLDSARFNNDGSERRLIIITIIMFLNNEIQNKVTQRHTYIKFCELIPAADGSRSSQQ